MKGEQTKQNNGPPAAEGTLDDFMGWAINEASGSWIELPRLIAQDLLGLEEGGLWPRDDECRDEEQIEALGALAEVLGGVSASVRERIELLQKQLEGKESGSELSENDGSMR